MSYAQPPKQRPPKQRPPMPDLQELKLGAEKGGPERVKKFLLAEKPQGIADPNHWTNWINDPVFFPYVVYDPAHDPGTITYTATT